MAHVSTRPKVLSFSHDMVLMMSRQWLLERNGYEVRSAMSQAEFRDRICRERIDLAVLCQTLTPEECDGSANFLHEHSPDTRCIVLYAREFTCNLSIDYVLLDANRGPAEFVSALRRMVPTILSA